MLSVVATPIGNLQDITLRALDTLRRCDVIVCEDTRVTGQLLKKLEIEKKPLISLHGYTNPKKMDEVVTKIADGAHVVLVSDAGTPGVSDPGYALTSRVAAAGLPMETVPGPSAFLAALSVSGLPMNQFVYLGFLPRKKGRQTLLQSFPEEQRTIVFYESVHRIVRTLNDLAEYLADQPDRPIVIARELTKMHEEVVHTTVAELSKTADALTTKGEFVVIIG